MTISYQITFAPSPDLFLGLGWDAWTALFTGLNALIVLIGVPIAVFSLRVITKQQYLASISRFNDELAATETQRRFLFRDFERKDDYSDIDQATEKKVRDLVNQLNRMALLLDERMLPPRIVLSLAHTMIIRCWYQLELYAAFEEKKIGGRYARRVKKLDQRAKNFHDARSHQRIHEIRLAGKDGKSILIYRTHRKKGFAGLIQRAGWWARYIFSWY